MLLDPITLCRVPLRNRIGQSPILENLAFRDGSVNPLKMNPHYLHAAKNEVGLVILESAYVSFQGRQHINQLGLSNETHLPRLKQLVDSLHEEGCKVGMRLTHAGARTTEKICLEQPIGPSPVVIGKDFDMCREFDEGDVEEVKLFFVHAAERAEEAGVDLVEINGAQQQLLEQCVSARINNRIDRYGSDLEGRLRLSTEIIADIRQRVSANIPISYLFSLHDKIEDDFRLEDLGTMLSLLTKAGVDILHPLSTHVLHKLFASEMVLMEWIRKYSKLPLLAEGNIKSPQVIKELLKMDVASLLMLDRALLTRPRWLAFLEKKLPPEHLSLDHVGAAATV